MNNKEKLIDPLFSVIIPTYNRADRLKVALDSLVAQTNRNFEVLVCDDGSTDDTARLVDSYKDKLDLKYIWEENWGGPARPRNNGIKASKGEWICFLDSDDWWYCNKLETCLKYINKYNLLYHHLDIYSLKNEKPNGKVGSWKLKDNIFVDLLVNGNAINNSSVVVKKELLIRVEGFSEDKDLVFVEDYDCWLKISKIENKLCFIPESLGAYWIGDNSSAASQRAINGLERIYEKYLPQLDYNDRKLALKNLNFRLGLNHYAMRNFENAILYFKLALTRKSLWKDSICFRFLVVSWLRMRIQ